MVISSSKELRGNKEKKKEVYSLSERDDKPWVYDEPKTYWWNSGTMRGWQKVNEEHKGLVRQRNGVDCSNSDRDGSFLEATQIYDYNWEGRFHADVGVTGAASIGRTGVYTFSYMLPEDWVYDEDNEYTILQFISDFTDLDCNKGAEPATKVWIRGKTLFTRVRTGDVCLQSGNLREYAIGRLHPGVWQTVVLAAHWTKNEDGFFKVWVNGEKILSRREIATMPDIDDRRFALRIGMYPNTWHIVKAKDGEYAYVRQKEKTIFIDDVVFGTIPMYNSHEFDDLLVKVNDRSCLPVALL
jgi:hypothetical protein